MPTPKTILIVEDEAMIAVHIEDTLSQLGHRVITASTRAEAERLAEVGGIDLAVLDYRLTDGTTETLMERLQQAGTPFIVCSGISRDENESGASETQYLQKPFTSDALIDAVSAMLATKRGGNDLH